MIIPAILEKDIKECERKIKLVEGACSAVQIDILDNTIVPGETFQDLQNLEEIKTLADITIHFMVKDPINLIRKLGFLFPPNTTKINGVSTLITQVADIQETENFLKYAKDLGYKTGISINSDQDILPLEGLIQGADIIQFMGVEPGKQGGEFIPSVLEKIKNFKNKYPEKTTQIDGGINDANITSVLETGVDNIIIGSAIFNSDDPKKKLLEFSTIFEQKRKNLTEQTSEIKINKKKNKRPLMICFLGGAAWKNEDEPYIQAKETAKLLAENGYGIVNGGGPGVMRASTEGAHEGGAGVLAVTYHPNKPKRHFEGVDPFISQCTKLLEEHVRRHRKIHPKFKRSSWHQEFHLLLQSLDGDRRRLEKVLTAYLAHPEGPYRPQADSANAFRSKFLQIETWCHRHCGVVKEDKVKVKEEWMWVKGERIKVRRVISE